MQCADRSAWKRSEHILGTKFHRHCEPAHAQGKIVGRAGFHECGGSHRARHRSEFLRRFHPAGDGSRRASASACRRCFSRCSASSESRSTSRTARFRRFPSDSSREWAAPCVIISRYSSELDIESTKMASRSLHRSQSAHVSAPRISAIFYYFHSLPAIRSWRWAFSSLPG